MKSKLIFLISALVSTLPAMSQGSFLHDPIGDPVSRVNPFIGTAGHGHTHPAAVVPHGMIQPGPDTRWQGWDACSGYHYTDSTVNGFSLTRLSGTGCADFGDFLFMPFTGKPAIAYAGELEKDRQQMPYASPFSHANEYAEPGYYSVWLDRYKVRTEITSAPRSAFFRFTYPEAKEAGIILDMDYAIQNQTNLDMDVEMVDSTTIRAHKRTYWWAYNQELFCYARFSKPFKEFRVVRDTVSVGDERMARCKVIISFPTLKDEQVTVRTAISAVDAKGAEQNLRAEIPEGTGFDNVRIKAREAWQKELSKITLSEDADSTQAEVFYTALYHTAIAPALFSDVDGRYRGMDLKVHKSDEPYYTVFSLWDTFRALHPLLSITDPAANEAYIRTLMRKGEEGGAVPKWDCASNYTACMIGYHFASLAADAVSKGYTNFDVKKALSMSLKDATGDTTGISPVVPKYKVRDLLPDARRQKTQLGYIPCDKGVESVARALEYAYDDWCISQLAKKTGSGEVEKEYAQKANYWQKYLHPTLRFMRGIDSNGKWRTPFDPRTSEHRADDFCEGNSWQWTWFVPHDVDGLIKKMGGRKAFLSKLDSLFNAPSELIGKLVSADISGLIGQYAHGNEPSHHTIYLYNYAGRPDRTQELCDSVLQTLYFANPNGLAGNEDCGQMSAWYVLSSMGLYQVCPGKPVWTIGRPLFPQATVKLPSGRYFTVRTDGNSRKAKYIRRATLNGKRLKSPFISHKQITEGGILVLEMSEKPQKNAFK